MVDGECVVRRVAGETILVPVRSRVADLECVFTLNDVASVIWQALQSPKSPDEIATQVVREFDVAPEAALRDVEDFVAGLEQAGLIRAEEASA